MSYKYKPSRSLGYGFQRVFSALLSDEPNIIHWFAWHVLPTLQASKGQCLIISSRVNPTSMPLIVTLLY